jgi:hypothetical protein
LAALRVVESIRNNKNPELSYRAAKDLLKGVGVYREQTDVSVQQVSDDQINSSVAAKIMQALKAQAVDADVSPDVSPDTPTIIEDEPDDRPALPYKSIGDMIRAENERRARRAAQSTGTDTDTDTEEPVRTQDT